MKELWLNGMFAAYIYCILMCGADSTGVVSTTSNQIQCHTSDDCQADHTDSDAICIGYVLLPSSDFHMFLPYVPAICTIATHSFY